MKKILFVDDDPRILDGLRRMLRGQRHEWDMDFAESGKVALELLSKDPYDVIVSDMRMPGMDGAELLTRVQEEHPSTVRIVLSGHAELEAALRAVPVAHQFLSKPCESDVIRNVVDRACSLQTLVSDEAITSLISDIDSLPSLPRVYHALTAALVDPEVSLDDVAEIVAQDTAITAKILQLVNSSFFGVPKTITDLRQATTFLGLNMLRNLTLSAEVFRSFEGCSSSGAFSLESMQAHSILSARIARHLLDDKRASEDAFMTAMLHDIGKLILLTEPSGRYSQVIDAAAGSQVPLHELEEQVQGVSHAEVGAYLLGLWGMSYPVVEAVANHHHPARVEQECFGILGAVHVADVLSHELSGVAAQPAGCPAPELDMSYLEALGVADRLPAWREQAALEYAAEADVAA